MRIFKIYIFVSFLLISCNLKKNTVSSYQYDLKSNYNKGYKEGNKVGIIEGRKKGKMIGYNEGLIKGLKLGKDTGIVLGYEKFKNEYKELSKVSPGILQGFLDDYGMDTYWQVCYDRGINYARDTFFNVGYKNGYNDCFNNIDTINLRLGQNVKQTNSIYKPHIDYNYIISELKNVKNLEYPYADLLTFSNIIETIHLEVLKYLSKKLDLSNIEEQELFAEYKRIHPDISKLYVAEFVKIYKATNFKYKNNFYDFKLYYTSLIFFEVINSGLCSVADAVLTYAKKNSQYGKIHGLSILGNTCEILQYEILPEINDAILKLAIKEDYDLLIPRIELNIKKTFKNQIVETRISKINITEQIEIEKNYKATVNMDILTFVNLGFDTSQIVVSVNHKTKEIIVSIPKNPKVIKLIKQTYEVKNIKHEISYVKTIKKEEYEYSLFWFWETPKPESKTSEFSFNRTITIKSTDFDKIFNDYRPKNLETINDFKKDFSNSKIINYENIIKQYFLPLINLPNSYYKVKLIFGNYHKMILINNI